MLIENNEIKNFLLFPTIQINLLNILATIDSLHQELNSGISSSFSSRQLVWQVNCPMKCV